MKCLERNLSTFYYSRFLGKSAVMDEYGNESGEYQLNYSPPVVMRGNISPARGTADIEQFGNDIKYDKVIVTDDMSCPIDENSVLYIDHPPCKGNTSFDYIVKKIARSLNSISIAVSKVSVS